MVHLINILSTYYMYMSFNYYNRLLDIKIKTTVICTIKLHKKYNIIVISYQINSLQNNNKYIVVQVLYIYRQGIGKIILIQPFER